MQETINFARNVRISALQMVHRAKASHIGSALSIIDIVSVLYGRTLSIDPLQPRFEERDRFILSKGHACVAVYAALAECGFLQKSELLTYGVDESPLMNHISHKVPGVEFSTGSLGHGLPFGVGKALAAKSRGLKWRTFVLMGDGELAEGSNWEAMLFAAHYCLDNLVVIIDNNNLQSLTTVDKTIRIEPMAEKFNAFGWSVIEVDGHDHAELATHLGNTPWKSGRPSALIARTIKGKGVSFMENKVEWHYRNPNDEQLAKAIAELESSL